jgi:hypothetical protein
MKVAGHVVGGSVKHGVLVCAGKQDLPQSEHRVMEPGNFRGGGSGMLTYELFFPFYPWLLVSLFADLERVFLLTGYGTLWVSFRVL